MVFDSDKGIQYLWREDKGNIAVTNTRPSNIFIFFFLFYYIHNVMEEEEEEMTYIFFYYIHIYKNEWTQVHDTINTHQY